MSITCKKCLVVTLKSNVGVRLFVKKLKKKKNGHTPEYKYSSVKQVFVSYKCVTRKKYYCDSS